MLQQTTLPVITRVYPKFLNTFPNVQALAEAEENQIKRACQGLGYYSRFRNMHRAAQLIHAEGWPQSYDDWRQLPGIGPYTAAAVSSICLKEPHAVVDGNVERVLSRLYGRDVSKKEAQMLAQDILESFDFLSKRKSPGDYNQALMELGQVICRKQSPECGHCPVSQDCLAYRNQSTHLFPTPRVRKEKVVVHLKLSIPSFIKKDKRYFGVVSRDGKSRFLKNTAGFPFLEEDKKKMSAVAEEKVLGRFIHSITHHKIHVRVIHERESHPTDAKQWMVAEDVAASLTSSLDMKAWKILQKSQGQDLWQQPTLF